MRIVTLQCSNFRENGHSTHTHGRQAGYSTLETGPSFSHPPTGIGMPSSMAAMPICPMFCDTARAATSCWWSQHAGILPGTKPWRSLKPSWVLRNWASHVKVWSRSLTSLFRLSLLQAVQDWALGYCIRINRAWERQVPGTSQ